MKGGLSRGLGHGFEVVASVDPQDLVGFGGPGLQPIDSIAPRIDGGLYRHQAFGAFGMLGGAPMVAEARVRHDRGCPNARHLRRWYPSEERAARREPFAPGGRP